MKKEILLFMTDFYGYNNEIIKSLEDKNINVTWFLDKINITLKDRLLKKVNKKYIDKKFDKYFLSCLEKIKNKKFDEILIIFGAIYIRKEHINLLKQYFPNVKIVYYAWDSVKNFPLIKDLLMNTDISYTFDPNDAIKYNVGILPLFYIKNSQIKDLPNARYDVSTVMSYHLEKTNSLKLILKKLPQNIKKNIYLKVRDRIYYLKLKIFNTNEINEINEFFKFTSLNRDETLKIFKESKAIIDCPLPNQIGLTMRTFEVLALKRKLITTNKNIVNYDFYCPENIYIVNGDNNYDFIEFLNSEFNQEYALTEKYSLSKFIDKLIVS